MNAAKENALPGGISTEEGEGVEILQGGVNPQSNHTTPAGPMSIVKLLQAGEAQAIHGEELARLLGVRSARAVRRMVEEARAAGVPVLSCHAGYYLPADGEAGQGEIRAYLAALRKKASKILGSGVQLELKLMELERRAGGDGLA